MIQVDPIPGFHFEHEGYAGLATQIVNSGLPVESLGASSDPAFEVYRLTVGDTAKLPVILMQSCIHGGEWESAHWALEFARIVGGVAPLNHAGHRETLARLRSHFSFVFVPCLNPYGYDVKSQGNANAVNLNRNYDYNWDGESGYETLTAGEEPFDQPETQMSRDLVLALKPVGFVDCHRHNSPQVWMSRGRYNIRRYDHAFYDLERSYNYSLGVEPMQHTSGTLIPAARAWAAGQTSSRGWPTVSTLIEGTSSETPTEHSRRAMTTLFLWLLMVEGIMYGDQQALHDP